MLPDLQAPVSDPARKKVNARAKRLFGIAVLLTAVLFLLPQEAGAVDILRESELAEGVTFAEGAFTPADGQERLFTMVIVQSGSAQLQLATPGDDMDNDGGDGKGASLLSMAEDAEKSGCTVFAAINGDFYKTPYDGGSEYAQYAPLGVMVKNGEILSEGQREQGATFFGITADSTAVLGSAESGGEWDDVKSTLQTAIGGELWLVKDGESNLKALRWRADTDMLQARYGPGGCVFDEKGERQILTAYPRTAIGIRADGSVVLLTVSTGSASPGVTVVQLSELLLELGCTQAMNLDGGPSTQMAVRQDGVLKQTRSMGISSRVGNGLLVVRNNEVTATEENNTVSYALPLGLCALLAGAALSALLLRKRKQGRHCH